MKLPCTVIEDMLPMYHDGICSDETEALVNEHLSQCPKCSNMLSQMHASLELPREEPDDLKPLKEIQKRWKQSERASVRKGICIGLAAILIVMSALSGIWYASYGKYYFRMTACMDPVPEEAIDMGSADYMKEIDGYRIGVWTPPVLSNSGFARVTDETGMVMFIYPQVGGGYTFKVSVRENNNRFYMIWLNPDLTPNYEDHTIPVRTEWEKKRIEQLLQEQKSQIVAMCQAVYNLWGIQLLEGEELELRLTVTANRFT